MKFDTIDTEYGEKLLVTFDYDAETVERIKSLDWETTHRSWNPDEEGWTLDLSPESIEEFERTLDRLVPPKYKPDDVKVDDETLTFTVPDEYTWFFIDNPPRDVSQQLNQQLSYEQPDAQYTQAYQRGEWDGVVRLYNDDSNGAPVGLLDRAREICEDMGYDVEVHWQGERTGDAADFSWEFEHELRSYQQEAMNSVLQDGGGIVGLPTGTGKTVTFLATAYTIGQETIVLVHTKELLYQWADEIRDILGVEPGVIGDGNWSEGPITVAIMQTLMSRGTRQLERNYGVMCFDECHRTSAADTMHEIAMDINVEWRIGLSATPWRRVDGEELKIEAATGGESYTVTAEEMIDGGYISEPEFLTVDPHDYGEMTWAKSTDEYPQAYARSIETSPVRNKAVADAASDLANRGYKVLVNVDRIAQGRILQYALNGSITEIDLNDAKKQQAAEHAVNQIGLIGDHEAEFLSGEDSTDQRNDVLDRFENGDLNVLISTILQEGVDIPKINAIVLAQGGKSDIQQIQTIGRALRKSGDDSAVIVDFEDRGRWFRDHFQHRQASMAEYYGKYGPDADSDGLDDDETVDEDELGGVISLTDDPPTYEEIFGDTDG